MIYRKIKNFFLIAKLERLVLVSAMLAGGLTAWYIYNLGLIRVLVDQVSHLNISRQVLDSMTPGITQVGSWPPLIHIIMAPFVYIDILYHTGLAGAFILVPLLALSALFLYRLLLSFTGHRLVSFAGAIIFLLNPYVLYYAVTPMMEMLFITTLLGTAYFLTRWLKDGKLFNLIFTAIFISLASLSRFEGLFLSPLAGLIILARLVKQKKKYKEIEALIILFYFVAAVGPMFTFLYGWVFARNPLEFLNGEWSAYSQQREYYLPAGHNILKSLQYLLHASYYMIGKYQIVISFLSLLILAAFMPSFELIAASLVLFSPFVLNMISLFRGVTVVYVPELSPFGGFLNERYGLTWIVFTIFTPMVLIGFIYSRQAPLPSAAKALLGNSLIVLLLFLNLSFLYNVSYSQKFKVIKSEEYPSRYEAEIADWLKGKYDFGKILMNRAMHNFVAINGGVDLKNYIQESNYRFYDQALERPWLFARYVVMINLGNKAISSSSWMVKNEKISEKWAESMAFAQFYELVLENKDQRLYKIREPALKKYAFQHGLNLSRIPSLNSEIKWWDPVTIYKDMNAESLLVSEGKIGE